MTRHGYCDEIEDQLEYGRWRAQVLSAIRGKRGQAFLRELAAAMDAMPEKVLIAEELINAEGDCCTIGVVCRARGLDVSAVDVDCPDQVGDLVGIAKQLAAEIEYENDDWCRGMSPADRWQHMRKWVDSHLKPQGA
jgi:hypothetical protein